MDAILTDFIGQTQADPALAQDLLDASGWDIKAALAMFSGLKDTRAVEPAEYEYDPSEYVCVLTLLYTRCTCTHK